MAHLSARTPSLALAALLGLSALACFQPMQLRQDQNTAEQPRDQLSAETKASQHTNMLQTADLKPLERRCEDRDAGSCAQFARQSIALNTPEGAARAAMSMYQSCELGTADGCYHYGLMVWLSVGAEYNARAIQDAFDRAKQLGSAHTRIAYNELLAPAAPGQAPSRDTLYHYEQACKLGIPLACNTAAANRAP